ncbi:SDR family oxidoreductase [Hyphococcus flavus]|uniref:SDR family oxidoreductase n=1 Tax=Hyphococcus flavus TaxID=1866326 RepID=A0AAE9ZAB6_9PROT|nr:SDR family oxidoreductase [Hyphococcus flavus]WDI30484.1 SDR family oxidoreductase [Hyphococcus flavus]
MPQQKLLCLGYGYTARAFAAKLKDNGWEISGTTRSREKAAQIENDGVEPIIWNKTFDPAWLADARAMLVSTPPNAEGCPALRDAGDAIARKAATINWIGYLSTNGVYGNHDGAWVDETSELRPTTERSRFRIDAEKSWRAHADQHDLPLIIFRLPGIYGPGRSALDRVRKGAAKRIYKKGQVFSRMHVDDIAAALKASMTRPRIHDLYNLADDEPCPPQDVIEFACKLVGVEPPPLIPLEEADLSDMAKSFYADNKRVSNQRMKDALAVTLEYATYKQGLEAILKQEQTVGR